MADDLIEQFFNKKLVTSHNTRKSYRGNINKYFKLLNKPMDTYFSKDKPLDEYDSDLNKVYMVLNKQKVPLLTVRTFFNSTKQFFIATDKQLKQLDFWDTLKTRVRGADPISEKFQLNNQDIKTILTHADTCTRAGGLIMAATGCRLGELLALRPNDINTTKEPSTVMIRGTYDPKEPGYIKPEATYSYLEWMKQRDRYLSIAVDKCTAKKRGKQTVCTKTLDDKRIFPMSDENFRKKWENMVKRTDLYEVDDKTKRLTLHPHCMRAFFRSYLGHSDLAEHLMGHATGMDKYYRNMKPEDLAKEYTKYMYNLVVFETKPDLRGISESLKQKDDEIAKMKADIEKMHNEILTLQNLETLAKLLKKT
jgi:integrase